MILKKISFCFLFSLLIFMVFFVNLNFGRADNGDFSRYFGSLGIVKPLGFTANWPEVGSDEWGKRFFRQPLFFWEISKEAKNAEAWSTSASFFWKAGACVNKAFYSKNVLNVKIVSLPFYIIHLLAYSLLFLTLLKCAPVYGYVRSFLLLLLLGVIYGDIAIISYYNSFFAESVMILFCYVAFSLLFSIYLFNKFVGTVSQRAIYFALIVITLFALAALCAKKQYTYFIFCIPIISFYMLNIANINKKIIVTWVIVSILVTLSVWGLYFVSVRGTSEMNQGLRVTSYNSLFQGILVYSENQKRMLEQLGLPEASQSSIGKAPWAGDGSETFIRVSEQLSQKLFIQAILLEPKAYIELLTFNMLTLGNFNTNLGMVHGEAGGTGGVWIRLSTTAAQKLHGALFVLGIILAFLFIGAYSRHEFFRSPIVLLSFILIFITGGDVVFSAFDGMQESAKHILCGSFAGIFIILLAFCLIITHNFSKKQ